MDLPKYHATARGAAAFQTRDCERCHSILGVGGDHTPDLGTIGTRKSMRQIKTRNESTGGVLMSFLPLTLR